MDYFVLNTPAFHVIFCKFWPDDSLMKPEVVANTTVYPTRYRNRHFFNNSISRKFEQEYVRCVRNEKECVCSVCL